MSNSFPSVPTDYQLQSVTYALDSRSHTAHKSVPFTFEFSGKKGEQFEFKVAPGSAATANTMTVTTPLAAGVAGARAIHPAGDEFTLKTEAGIGQTFVFRTKTNNANEVKEQLGKQIIEGVEAEGTRTTVTIAAGEIGNERPIEIVSERWYSPELQLVVMTRNSDPRSGETTYKLTNINRSEPAKSLFEVPSDYTIKEGPGIGPKIAPLRKKVNPE